MRSFSLLFDHVTAAPAPPFRHASLVAPSPSIHNLYHQYLAARKPPEPRHDMQDPPRWHPQRGSQDPPSCDYAPR
ncbi:hypothetical protein EDB89DRAFT_2066080 [Lactarius sanguifluus]|nr:hypothetical protein EDB89DRAFT_2066080 [Lactarius sanguifluus]